jgi:hypothetical protein
MIDPIWNNFSHRERNLKSCCPPPPKFFFLLSLKIFFSTAQPLFEKDRWGLNQRKAWKFYILHLKNLFYGNATKGPIKHRFFLSLKIFFSTNEPFLKRPMSPRTNGKRENSTYYNWKTFFKATRRKGRSNTDFFLSLKIFFSTNESFFKRPMSPRTNGKRGNSIYYT